ncbi:MAG TPA: metalloregulator ArsR/SmtB family transcription factor [Candidatus Agrococcus pullicola]|uniref:Metalloregulator ArsR/SmtB family transcription factor n=1 Tax=Candidatus Agrococcus pullicola TaxID=2838429 RepID=A0A9D1YTC5_9MICO|nr:metalloregulator ArsR/SmtB family transcription factor [Candidatus Agrococcus pullicola]
MGDIFSVVADSTRREILEVLLERRSNGAEASVSEIVDALGVTQPTVSKHLKVLREAGLATVRDEGQHRYYSIDVQPLDELDDWLMPFIFAEHSDDQHDGLGAAAFAAWADVTGSLRNAAEQARNRTAQAKDAVERVAQDPKPFGESVGRRAAEVVHEARTRAEDAIEQTRDRLGR